MTEEVAAKPVAAFTPGPWQIIPYGDGDSLVIQAGQDRRVCFMATPGDSPSAMEWIEANARLIAAAPELLAALWEISQRVAREGGGTQHKQTVPSSKPPHHNLPLRPRRTSFSIGAHIMPTRRVTPG